MKILITGSNGYLGRVLIKFFLDKGQKVIGIDKNSSITQESSNFKFCQIDLRSAQNFPELKKLLPVDVFIHAAFLLRTRMNPNKTLKGNLSLCENVFKLCFESNIPKLIYFSSAAIYGAYPKNQLDYFFKESDPQREEESAYGWQKALSENLLSGLYGKSNKRTRVIVLRLASAVGDSWKKEESKKISLLGFFQKLPFILKSSNKFSRQFIHENDVARACEFLISKQLDSDYEVFNLAPPDYLTIDEIAEILKKRVVYLPPAVLRFLFYFGWLVSLGKIPTGYRAFKSYLYPINIDGKKITQLGFKYKFNSQESLPSSKY
ncbi:MAG TPA: NAD(P)-dependent oxidoreductase [Candidatus Humimicrobiaceae bacterium]|nr:NAD(P)-dependent oxidoreductase [Candidatus Humimicrobiaceae bacterium]